MVCARAVWRSRGERWRAGAPGARKPRLRGAVRLHFHHLRHGEIGGRDTGIAGAAAAPRARTGAADPRRRTAEDYAPSTDEAAPRRTESTMITTHVLDIARSGPAG